MLKKRLKLIYNMIPNCKVISDIGTDHALLPAFALINGKCVKAIACDVRKGPLKRAKETVNQFSLNDKMELRLGDGLEPILEEEVDTIVIAGMGGQLIAEILDKSISKAKRANNIILQPMTKQGFLRVFLWKHGFEILDEALAKEGEKLYQVLKVRYTGTIRKAWEPINEIIGEKLIEKKDPFLSEWITAAIQKQEKVVEGLKVANTSDETLNMATELLMNLKKLLN
ncbi:MAG: SAM-dependent methyltransferase [Clostridiaceae bacterium]|nr:SAM-dependent methyltransferase [Clostridiaceae bacterium]